MLYPKSFVFLQFDLLEEKLCKPSGCKRLIYLYFLLDRDPVCISLLVAAGSKLESISVGCDSFSE